MQENIRCNIEYQAYDNPKCRIIVNGRSIHNFVATNNQEQFNFEVPRGSFVFRILHHGKDMKKDIKKFIEIKKIYFNDIDFKNMLWETEQVPDLPKWQKKEDFKWQSNLHLGHNGYIEYKIESPIVDFFKQYHTKGAKVSSNMGSYDMKLLYEMKDYFSKIVEDQDAKS